MTRLPAPLPVRRGSPFSGARIFNSLGQQTAGYGIGGGYGGYYDPNYLQYDLAQQQFDREDRRYQQALQQQGQRFDLLRDLLKGQQQGYNDAKQANESRYLDILQMMGQTRNDVKNDLAGYGQSQIDDINRAYDVNRKNELAALAARGMPGSTARIAIDNRNAESRGRALNRVQDDIINRRVNTDLAMTGGNIPGFMERRTDAYPPPADLSAIGQMLGAGSGYTPPNPPSYAPPPPVYAPSPGYGQPLPPPPVSYGAQPTRSGGRFQMQQGRPAGTVAPRGNTNQTNSPIKTIAGDPARQQADLDARAARWMAGLSDASHGGLARNDRVNQIENMLVNFGYGQKGPDVFHYTNQQGAAPGVNWGGGTPAGMLPGGQQGVNPAVYQQGQQSLQQGYGQPPAAPTNDNYQPDPHYQNIRNRNQRRREARRNYTKKQSDALQNLLNAGRSLSLLPFPV